MTTPDQSKKAQREAFEAWYGKQLKGFLDERSAWLGWQAAQAAGREAVLEEAANIALSWSNNLADEWEKSRKKVNVYNPPGEIVYSDDAKKFAAEMLACVQYSIRALKAPAAPQPKGDKPRE